MSMFSLASAMPVNVMDRSLLPLHTSIASGIVEGMVTSWT